MTTFQQLPALATHALLLGAQERDLVTARRAALLKLLWQERYLSREQLIARVEMILGTACFGEKAWEDTFYRDMRFVKHAYASAGYKLKYTRDSKTPGYYLDGEPTLHPALTKSISGALDELDPKQIAIYKSISPAQKFFQAASIIDLAMRVSAEAGE